MCSMNQNRRLPPLTGDPDPATRAAFPVTFHPDCRRARTQNPTARHPFIMGTSPPPITARPNITRTRRNCSGFNSHRRRRLRNQNLTPYCPGRTSGHSFARSCRCRRCRNWRFGNAPCQSEQRQQIKRHPHMILPIWVRFASGIRLCSNPLPRCSLPAPINRE
jgi:hypothetical protein